MSSIIEIFKSIKHPEVNSAVGEKAKELWGLLAPDRRPDLDSATAMTSFHYAPSERYHIDERNNRGLSREIKVLDAVLRPYWETERDAFQVELHIHPNYFNHGKVDKGSTFFELDVTILPPQNSSDGKYITVFGFGEYSQDKSFNPFKKHHKQGQIVIFAENKFYSGDLSRIMIGRPADLQNIRLITLEEAAANQEHMTPQNIAWRNKFAMDILDHFISHERENSLEERKSKDEEWQKRSKQQQI